MGFPAHLENRGRASKSIRQSSELGPAGPVRHGALLLELIICGMLLGVIVSAIIPTLAWLTRERQNGRQQQAALLEVGNLMERLSMLEWDDLTSQRAATFELSEGMRTEFPDAHLTVTVTVDADAKAKHVLLELQWEFAPGRPAPPVRLAAWVYQHGK